MISCAWRTLAEADAQGDDDEDEAAAEDPPVRLGLLLAVDREQPFDLLLSEAGAPQARRVAHLDEAVQHHAEHRQYRDHERDRVHGGVELGLRAGGRSSVPWKR